MTGRLLMSAMVSMTVWLNNFGTVLTPMMPVGRNSLIASTNFESGA